MTYTLTFADGRTLAGVQMNGTCFFMDEKPDESLFTKEALKTLTITPDSEASEPEHYGFYHGETTLKNAVANPAWQDWQDHKWHFSFYERSQKEMLEEAMLMAIAEIYEKVAMQEAN